MTNNNEKKRDMAQVFPCEFKRLLNDETKTVQQ